MSKGKSKPRWDLYAWVGAGGIKLRESNLTFKDAKKAKEKWIAKSPKHEAFIASHDDKAMVKDLLKREKAAKKPKDAKSAKKSK